MGSPDNLTTKSIIFPSLGRRGGLASPEITRTLYLVTKSSVAFAMESAGFGGSDIVEGEVTGWEVR